MSFRRKLGDLAWHLCTAFSQPSYLPSSAFFCLHHLCCNTSFPPFWNTSFLTPPSNPPPCSLALSLLFLFTNVPFILSFHPSMPPLAPFFEPGLVSVDPEVCQWADGLISGWGNGLRSAERGQGPWPGSSAWTCYLHKREKLHLPWCLGIWTALHLYRLHWLRAWHMIARSQGYVSGPVSWNCVPSPFLFHNIKASWVL